MKQYVKHLITRLVTEKINNENLFLGLEGLNEKDLYEEICILTDSFDRLYHNILNDCLDVKLYSIVENFINKINAKIQYRDKTIYSIVKNQSGIYAEDTRGRRLVYINNYWVEVYTVNKEDFLNYMMSDLEKSDYKFLFDCIFNCFKNDEPFNMENFYYEFVDVIPSFLIKNYNGEDIISSETYFKQINWV